MESVINVEPRNTHGKGAARKMRKDGRIPGILYGGGAQPLSFSVEPNQLDKTLRSSGAGRNTIFRVKGLNRELLAILKDTQIDPIKRRLIHVDMIEVREDQEVVVAVALELVGKAIGTVEGGILQAVRREVRVACRPLSIPKSIQIDVTELDIGDALHISDIQFPEGTRGADPGHWAVCTVVAPAAEEKPSVAEVAPVEGAVAAAGAVPAEGAAPAAPEEKEKKGKEKD
ncbi:MAG: 50S ribosomal protein L25 [Deltaproteobacteria bacterium]|nr:50S ribosomal protein L25 [Deltaproteobacteria bacterium]